MGNSGLFEFVFRQDYEEINEGKKNSTCSSLLPIQMFKMSFPLVHWKKRDIFAHKYIYSFFWIQHMNM